MAATCTISTNSVIGVESLLRNNGKKAIKNMMTFGFVRLTKSACWKYFQFEPSGTLDTPPS
jgi:hypothetical protein